MHQSSVRRLTYGAVLSLLALSALRIVRSTHETAPPRLAAKRVPAPVAQTESDRLRREALRWYYQACLEVGERRERMEEWDPQVMDDPVLDQSRRGMMVSTQQLPWARQVGEPALLLAHTARH